ncbi:MAG TPA: hypothetical protein VF175_13700, partial [Lacipirellula sp.]
MHWKRRQPKWPYLAGLVCLFFITIAAPWSWQQRPAEESELESLGFEDSAPALNAPAPTPAAKPTFVRPAPALPPLAAPTAPEPSLAGPMVIADDYVAVDEPLTTVEEPELEESTTAEALAEEVAAEPAVELAEPIAENLQLRPPSRSVLVRNVSPPAAVAR